METTKGVARLMVRVNSESDVSTFPEPWGPPFFKMSPRASRISLAERVSLRRGLGVR